MRRCMAEVLGIRWPLGHRLQVHGDGAHSRVSRSYTCMTAECWVGQPTPSWRLGIKFTGSKNCSPSEARATSKIKKEEKWAVRRPLRSVWCVSCGTQWACMNRVCIYLWVSLYSTLWNTERREWTLVWACFLKIITRTMSCWVRSLCPFPQ